MSAKNIFSDNRNTLIYPSVLASTKLGDPVDGTDAPAFVEFVTNNQDTVIRGYVYWHRPDEENEDRTPVLMIELDDEDEGPDTMDITIRVRRNDGLVYEGTRSDQEVHGWDVTRERPEEYERWQYEANNGDTLLGFLDWLKDNVDNNVDEEPA